MSTELTRRAQRDLVAGGPVSKQAGKSMAIIGGSGLVAIGAAGLIPFLSLPVLFVILVLTGGYLYIK